jgi:hypothetical protein
VKNLKSKYAGSSQRYVSGYVPLSALNRFAIAIIRFFLGGVRGEGLVRSLGLARLRSFFYFALLSLKDNQLHSTMVHTNSYFEFGVGCGQSLMNYVEALKTFCKDAKENINDYHIFLFDSFEGLPAKHDFRDDLPCYDRGFFAHDVSEIRNLLANSGMDLSKGNIHFVEGFFDETLTPVLRESLKEHLPGIITVDVDYYSSTKVVLDWLQPILPTGAYFYFDDVWSFHGNPRYGELAAINEFNKSDRGFLTACHTLSSGEIADSCYVYSKKEIEVKLMCAETET